VVRTTNMWMQIFDHVGRSVFGGGASYWLTDSDVNYIWRSIYTNQLINAKHLIEIAEKKQSPYNAAVGQILTAYILGITTDLWDDIPYLDALREYEIMRKPVYDTQEQIYASIDSLLDKAFFNLNLDASKNLIDIEGDVFYNGDPAAWLKAARAIKARHKLQLSRQKGTASYTDALELTDAFKSNADNMRCPFSASNQNPLFQFMEQRSGDLVMCSTLLNEMEANSDPRIPFYYGDDADGGISGSDPGSENFNASVPGEYLAGQTSPTYLMSYAELKFIEAEAAWQTGDSSRAVIAYKDAVAASVLEVTGDANTSWLDTYINIENAGTMTLEKIIMQKRHALVGQLQPYSDWRRTGLPELLPEPGARHPAIPQRFPYPQDEILYNKDNVPDIGSIIEPVWWAQ